LWKVRDITRPQANLFVTCANRGFTLQDMHEFIAAVIELELSGSAVPEAEREVAIRRFT
jgi:hypothetical protein